MNILACIKQVIDTSARIKILNGQVDAQGSPRVINPYDEFALEEALRIREARPDSDINVTALSLGPESSKDALKTALAMGADRAIHLCDPVFEQLDNLGVAKVLSLVAESNSFDLILCGRQAVDDDMAQVGPALAVFLKVPFVSVVTRLVISDDLSVAQVTRQVEGGSEIIEAPLPLLVTCQKGLNAPRLPSLKGIMAAKKKTIEVMNAKTLEAREEIIGSYLNTVVPINLVLPPERKKGRIIEGSNEQAVTSLIQYLKEGKVI